MTDSVIRIQATGAERTVRAVVPPSGGIDFLKVYKDEVQARSLGAGADSQTPSPSESVAAAWKVPPSVAPISHADVVPTQLTAPGDGCMNAGAGVAAQQACQSKNTFRESILDQIASKGLSSGSWDIGLGLSTALASRYGLDRVSASPLGYTPYNVLREPGHASIFNQQAAQMVQVRHQVAEAVHDLPPQPPAPNRNYDRVRAFLERKGASIDQILPSPGQTKAQINASIDDALHSAALRAGYGTADATGIANRMAAALPGLTPQSPFNALRSNLTEQLRLPPAGYEAGGVSLRRAAVRGIATAGIASALSVAVDRTDHTSTEYRALTPSNTSLALLTAVSALPIGRNFGRVMGVASVAYLASNYFSNDPEIGLGVAKLATQTDAQDKTAGSMGDAIDKWVKVGTTKAGNLQDELHGFLQSSKNDQGSALDADRRKSVILRMAEAEMIINEVKQRALPMESYNEAVQDLNLSQNNLRMIQQSEPNADMREIVRRQYDDTQALRNSTDGFGALGLITGPGRGSDSQKP